MRYYEYYPPYVSVAERRAKAEKKLRQLQKKYPNLQPVILEGQSLAKTWWGKAWNRNLERYADYSNRIGRGRSYVRHRAVLDLRLKPGNVTAMVQGNQSQPYDVVVKIDKLSTRHWATIRKACEGCFDSLSDLLAGRFPQVLKDLFFEEGAGLFPTPREIHFDCSCPDWASMCKHVAATLYGVGARLDGDPALFFTLRGIKIDDLITQTVTDAAQALLTKAGRRSRNVLQDVDLGDVFGIELDGVDGPLPEAARRPQTSTSGQPVRRARKTADRRRAPVKKARAARAVPPRNTVSTAPPTGRAVAPARRTASTRAVAASPELPRGSMLEALVKAVGRSRKGKTVDHLQQKLGWTKTQVRNAISRAGTKGLIETVRPGVYRVRA